jgi:hypothetical protein
MVVCGAGDDAVLERALAQLDTEVRAAVGVRAQALVEADQQDRSSRDPHRTHLPDPEVIER